MNAGCMVVSILPLVMSELFQTLPAQVLKLSNCGVWGLPAGASTLTALRSLQIDGSARRAQLPATFTILPQESWC